MCNILTLPSNSLRVLYTDELQDCLEHLGIQGKGRKGLGEKLACTEVALALNRWECGQGAPDSSCETPEHTGRHTVREAVNQTLCTS